ncbi:MAG TPA: phenylalanine--tRNA ligase beta subunit-related protein, partial [Thermoanaerobaculia bacterium]|nr:phenylalanine--tRNA ligase beta subunit-related protein [Thermoanaerobaculia bacterium]
MLFSLDWLRDYVDLPEAPAQIARRLTAAGLAVDGIEEKDGDAVFDIDVTTNRPDAMNHLGLARELAVLFERPLRPPQVALAESGETVSSAVRSIAVADPEGCPRYVARVVTGVRVGEGPAWLRKRLSAIGLRSINNLVDVTNYVLWETGQPLHAFDLRKLAGPALVIRRAADGERLTTLD